MRSPLGPTASGRRCLRASPSNTVLVLPLAFVGAVLAKQMLFAPSRQGISERNDSLPRLSMQAIGQYAQFPFCGHAFRFPLCAEASALCKFFGGTFQRRWVRLKCVQRRI